LKLTEDNFYESLFTRLPPAPREVIIPPGDDCAGLECTSGQILLFTTDQVVADVHYVKHNKQPAAPAEIAYKLFARNVSDIAAMGGTPLYCLTSMAQYNDRKWLDSFFDGLILHAKTLGVHIIGGDIVSAPGCENASLTLIGKCPAKTVCLRQGAEPGDIVFATGYFGSSFETGYHMACHPRHAEGRWLAENNFAKAMIDVSDGLLLDLLRLCRASSISVSLDKNKIPRRTEHTTFTQALTEGEDYELIFAVKPSKAELLEKAWPFDKVPLTQIGTFKDSLPPAVTDSEGNTIEPKDAPGYQHNI